MADKIITGTPVIAGADLAPLANYLGVQITDLPSNVETLMDRAEELIEYVIVGNLDTDDSEQVEAVKNAKYAQVEYWLNDNQEAEFSGGIKSYTAGKIQVTYQDSGRPQLAPRAYRTLFKAGLLYRGVWIS